MALYLDFEGAKNILVLQVLIWGFGRYWSLLPGILLFDLDLDMNIVTALRYIYDPNYGSLS